MASVGVPGFRGLLVKNVQANIRLFSYCGPMSQSHVLDKTSAPPQDSSGGDCKEGTSGCHSERNMIGKKATESHIRNHLAPRIKASHKFLHQFSIGSHPNSLSETQNMSRCHNLPRPSQATPSACFLSLISRKHCVPPLSSQISFNQAPWTSSSYEIPKVFRCHSPLLQGTETVAFCFQKFKGKSRLIIRIMDLW